MGNLSTDPYTGDMKNYTIYLDGKPIEGRIEEIELPDIKYNPKSKINPLAHEFKPITVTVINEKIQLKTHRQRKLAYIRLTNQVPELREFPFNKNKHMIKEMSHYKNALAMAQLLVMRVNAYCLALNKVFSDIKE